MKKRYYEKWEYRLWLSDVAVRRLTPEHRGIWFDWLNAMMEGDTYFIEGTIEELADRGDCTTKQAIMTLADIIRSDTAEVEVDDSKESLSRDDVTHFVRNLCAKSARPRHVFRLISRKRKKILKVRVDNRLRQEKKRKRGMSRDCHAQNHAPYINRDIQLTTNVVSKEPVSRKAATPSTHRKPSTPREVYISPDEAKDYGWAVDKFYSQFTDSGLRLTIAQCGLIAGKVKNQPLHHQAWDNTIDKYVGNFKPSKPNSYNPANVATVIDVFEDELAKLEGKRNGNGRPDAEERIAKAVQSRDLKKAVEQRIAERKAGVPGRTVPGDQGEQ